MSILKDKYEISLWEDKPVDGHYEEEKIGVIGSDSMTAQFRAIEPKLVENVNGSNTLTFKMYYTYIDNETGRKVQNPFIKLLVNERKVKALWKEKWYDFVIKSIQENSSDKSITYTCKDQFINELSKSGFELEFSSELMNNQGTITELAEKVLDGSDWKLGTDNTTPIELKEEALYLGMATSSFTAINAIDTTIKKTIAIGKEIYIFYSTAQNKESRFQFIYYDSTPITDENNNLLVFDEAQSWYIEGVTYSKSSDGYNIVSVNGTSIIEYGTAIFDKYRGERPVRQQKQVYDKAVDRYVYLYNNGAVAGYVDTLYQDPTVVMNLLGNAKDFTDTTGWLYNNNDNTFFEILPKPEEAEDFTNYNGISYLRLKSGYTSLNNNTIQYQGSYLPDEGFVTGAQYCCRIQLKENSYTGTITIVDSNNNVLFTFNNWTTENNWQQSIATCEKSIVKSDLFKKIPTLKISCMSTDQWIKEIQFFQVVEGEDENGTSVIYPGEVNKTIVATPRYVYYNYNEGAVEVTEDNYIYTSDEPNNSYEPVYNDNYEKIRAIEGKNSNRFNWLQKLAESFECYVKFEVERNLTTGKLDYDENGFPKKWITFVKEVGEETGISFVYGIDLKTISRTINSEQIATKVIVTPNINEYAENGICEIAQSKENYCRENFILNFDYYITHGMLSSAQLNRDLYNNETGYYYKLYLNNKSYYEEVDKLTPYKNEKTRLEALQSTYSSYVKSAEEEIAILTNDVWALVGGASSWEDFKRKYTTADNLTINSKLNSLAEQRHKQSEYSEQLNLIDNAIDTVSDKISEYQTNLDSIIAENKTIHADFYKKYSRFIQEGSWTSQEHIDPDLYYLDALGVAYTSSRPQISYNISVLRLSALEEFKAKIFNIGDTGYIQDTEFFGYQSDMKTPYKEKILISEITSYFDSPERDSFKVQNYKTQYEDLFQRITATTQSLQYASGEYQRAANVVESDGTIKPETLQNSLYVNQNMVISAQNENIKTDHTGLTVRDNTNPLKITKLTSGGLFISVDGGLTWKNAVRGEGISTQFLTSGAIYTDNISIMNGSNSLFRWDSNGLHAYEHKTIKDESGTEYFNINLNNFVRFDQYGIYGINGLSSDTKFDNTDTIRASKEALFGLLWDGFFLKGKNDSFEINPTDGFIVKNGDVNRIQIGNIGSEDNPVYGIKLKDNSGTVTLETTDDGKLWLRDVLNISDDVRIGNLADNKAINANGNFIVYQDGTISANGGTFTGTIYAESGKIGNLTIGEIENGSKYIEIYSEGGNSFITNSDETTATPAELVLKVKATNVTPNSYKWYESNDYINWGNPVSSSTEYALSYNNINFGDGQNEKYYKVVVTESDNSKEYEDYFTINKLRQGKDGQPGEPGKDGSNGKDGNGITSTVIEYGISDFGTIEPTSWQSTVPNIPQGKYLWTKTTIAYTEGEPVSTYSVSYGGIDGENGQDGAPGADAKSIRISGSSYFLYSGDGQQIIGPTIITLTAIPENTTVKQWYYKVGSTGEYQPIENATSTTLQVDENNATYFTGDSCTFKVESIDSNIFDEHTIVKLKNGAPGTETVFLALTNDNQMVGFLSNEEEKTNEDGIAITTLKLYESSEEITDFTASFDIPNSTANGIVGSFIEGTHNFKVTKMKDTGNVIFTVIHNGAEYIKTYSLVRIESGVDGKSPEIYSMELSTLVVNKDKQGIYTPAAISFNGYKTVGNNKDLVDVDFYCNNTKVISPLNSEDAFGDDNVLIIEMKEKNTTNVLDSQTIILTVDGTDGARGDKGDKGDPGNTPEVGDNGNWWIGGVDTNIPAIGQNGSDGATPYIGENGNWWINNIDTNVKAEGKDSEDAAGYQIELDTGEIIIEPSYGYIKDVDGNDVFVMTDCEPYIDKYYFNANRRIGDTDNRLNTSGNDSYELSFEIYDKANNIWLNLDELKTANIYVIQDKEYINTNRKVFEYDNISNRWCLSLDYVLKEQEYWVGEFEEDWSVENPKDSFIINDTLDSFKTILYSPRDAKSLRVTLKNNQVNTSISYFLVRETTAQDLLAFQVNATDITAAINNSGLKFDANGLTITNSGFKIIDSNNSIPLLEVVDNGEGTVTLNVNGTGTFSGQLIAANGTFSGELVGANGTFSGEITAESGTIGGLIIKNNLLASQDVAFDENNDYIEGSGSLVLTGNGEVFAKKIKIGNEAQILSYIGLGNIGENGKYSAYIRNPDIDDNINRVFLETGNGEISLYASGLMKLGDLTFNGINSTIESENWYINKDEAVFNKVIAEGGEIQNVVFKNSTVQAAGGQMIFRPSWRVDELTTLEKITSAGLKNGDIVILGQKDLGASTVELIIDEDNNNFGFYNSDGIEISDLSSYSTITQIWTTTNSKPLDLLIGINSNIGDSQYDPTTNLIHGGLSFIELNKEKSLNGFSIERIPHLFLGNLTAIQNEELKLDGYGLYCDNVYLKGQLTTQVPRNSSNYAGINTESGEKSFKWQDEEIVFWAGAGLILDEETGKENIDIANSPFHVTKYGNMYAGKGYFSGAIITESTITAATLEAATISGTGNGLTIKDTTQGIVFVDKDDNPLFTIGPNGLYAGSIETDEAPFLRIDGNSVSLSLSTLNLGNFTFNENTISANNISLTFGDANSNKMHLNSAIDIEGETHIYNKLFLEQNDIGLEFRSVTGGYDIYIN